MRHTFCRCLTAAFICLASACISGTMEEADSALAEADSTPSVSEPGPSAEPSPVIEAPLGTVPGSSNTVIGTSPNTVVNTSPNTVVIPSPNTVVVPSPNTVVVPSPNTVVTPKPTSPNVPISTKPGTFGYLASNVDPGACLDRPVDTTVAPGQYSVQMYPCNYTMPQTFVYTTDGSLKASDNNRCLTLPAPNADANLAIITAQTCSQGAQNQKWDAVSATWRNRANGQCLDLVSGDPGRGARLLTTPCTGALSQQWRPLTDPNTPVADPLATATTVPARCSPTIAVTFTVGDANRQFFEQHLPNFLADARQAALDVCAIAFAKAADVPPERSTMLIRIRPTSEVGTAYSIGREISVGFDYITGRIKTNDLQDIRGMLHHEITHYYQRNSFNAPSWLIEGMAEFVRFKSGYVNNSPVKGRPYTDSYSVSGFFLIWLENEMPGFFRRLMIDMQRSSPAWSSGYFLSKTGRSFDDLWNAYQATL